MQDSELLKAYAAVGNEAAFAELARRYVDLVYSTALRRLNGDVPAAEEVTQTVFLLAARKADALASHPALAGWMYRTACHAGDKARRAELRRHARELEAAQMHNPEPDESQVEQVLPLLDEALQELNDSDRLVVLLRFFLKKPMRDVGLALGVSEAAAKMRVSRAIDRLRSTFARRGVACSALVLAAFLEQRAVQAAPVALLGKIAAGVSQVGSSGVVASWITKTLILMSYTKATTIGVAVMLLALLGVGVYHFTEDSSEGGSDHTSRGKGPGTNSQTTIRVMNRFGTGPGAAFTGVADPTTVAVERLRAALGTPLPKSGISWPCEEVIQAMAAFTDKHAAFEALKAAVAHPEELFTGNLGVGDPENMVRDRAVCAMRYLIADVPQVRPFLWDTYRNSELSPALSAFMELKAAGLKADDLATVIEGIPALSRAPAGRRYIPQGIADVIATDPQGSANAIAALQGLLSNTDENVRFSAACALATSQLADPRVSSMLGKPLTNLDTFSSRMSVEALEKARAKAAGFVPAMLELAKSTTDEYLRKDTLRAVATIQPDAVANHPEIAELLAGDAAVRDIGTKLNKGNASLDDLVAALRLPQYTTLAAAQIGELGTGGAKALPLLRQALEGRNEDERERILEAIYKVAPDTRIERVDAKTMTDTMMYAEISLGARGNNYEDPLTKLIVERRAFSTWWTRDEVVSFAQKLNALEPSIARIFTGKVIERDPTMSEVLAGIGGR